MLSLTFSLIQIMRHLSVSVTELECQSHRHLLRVLRNDHAGVVCTVRGGHWGPPDSPPSKQSLAEQLLRLDLQAECVIKPGILELVLSFIAYKLCDGGKVLTWAATRIKCQVYVKHCVV